MSIGIYTLTSALHDAESVSSMTNAFLESLNINYDLQEDDFRNYGCHTLELIYIRTGGTEGIFKRLLPDLRTKSHHSFYLLTSGHSNSLAASMEILSYLRQQGLSGEILHGKPSYITARVKLLERVQSIRQSLRGKRLGIIGVPSDWLISSNFNKVSIKKELDIDLLDIPIEELIREINSSDDTVSLSGSIKSIPSHLKSVFPGAVNIYKGLKSIIHTYQLHGFTIRCFDLLEKVHNTGCLALAKLNSEGIVSGCEGDVPSLITMVLGHSLTGFSGFQANPSRIDPETGELLFAHCTIPLNMVEHYEYDTHFESGIGIGIRGYMKEGPVTIFKLSGDLTRCFIAEGELLRSESASDLCRTQQVIKLKDKNQVRYFLTTPIGNHHIILPGHHQTILEALVNQKDFKF